MRIFHINVMLTGGKNTFAFVTKVGDMESAVQDLKRSIGREHGKADYVFGSTQ